MRSLAVIFLVLSVTPALGETTQLAGIPNRGGLPSPHASLIEVGACFTTCESGGASKDCAPGQSCSCYCDGSGRAVCEICR
ncbi:hypothetical protein MCBRY_001025 [Methylocystis bryophila]